MTQTALCHGPVARRHGWRGWQPQLPKWICQADLSSSPCASMTCSTSLPSTKTGRDAWPIRHQAQPILCLALFTMHVKKRRTGNNAHEIRSDSLACSTCPAISQISFVYRHIPTLSTLSHLTPAKQRFIDQDDATDDIPQTDAIGSDIAPASSLLG